MDKGSKRHTKLNFVLKKTGQLLIYILISYMIKHFVSSLINIYVTCCKYLYLGVPNDISTSDVRSFSGSAYTFVRTTKTYQQAKVNHYRYFYWTETRYFTDLYILQIYRFYNKIERWRFTKGKNWPKMLTVFLNRAKQLQISTRNTKIYSFAPSFKIFEAMTP